MSKSAPSKKLQFTVVKAYKLPKSSLLRRSKCYYASITVGSEQTQMTKRVKGPDPEWDESFIFDTHETSAVTIQIFNASEKQAMMIAEVTFTVARCFQPGFQSIERICYDLLSPGSSSKRQGGTVIVSFAPSGSSEAVVLGDSLNPIGSPSATKPERDQTKPGLNPSCTMLQDLQNYQPRQAWTQPEP